MVILRIREQPSHEAVRQLVPTRNSNRATITAACWNRKRPRPSPPPYLAVLDLSSEHDPDASPPLHVHHLPSESHRWPSTDEAEETNTIIAVDICLLQEPSTKFRCERQ